MIDRPTRTSGPLASKLGFDLIVIAALCALFYGMAQVAAQWRQPLRQAVDIDLSIRALPKYALLSLARGWIAYVFSLLFTVLVGSWAYHDARSLLDPHGSPFIVALSQEPDVAHLAIWSPEKQMELNVRSRLLEKIDVQLELMSHSGTGHYTNTDRGVGLPASDNRKRLLEIGGQIIRLHR